MADMGGWSLTEDYAEPGTMCLQRDEGNIDIVSDSNPLTPYQMRALGEYLIRTADEMEK